MLTEILDALLSPFDGTRKHGEQLLKETERTDAEFGVKLALVLRDVRGSIAHRQLCGVLLKQFILNHWMSGSTNYRPPQVSEQAKMKIRETLPDCLGDADRSVRASAAYAVAAVAAFDWPTQWPDLIEALVRALASPNPHLVHGAMHALADLATLVTERQSEFRSRMEKYSQTLLPHLLRVLVTHDGTFSADTQKRAVTVFQTLAKSIAGDSLACKRTLLPWIGPYSEALIGCQEAMLLTNSTNLGCSLRILQTLSWLSEHFARVIAVNFGERLILLHVRLLRHATDKHLQWLDSSSSWEDSVSVDSFVLELCEMAQSLSGQRHFDQWMSSSLADIIDSALYLMQITPAKAEEWTSNVAQFIEDEDEDGLVDESRAASRNMLLSIVEDHGVSALKALCNVAERHLKESEENRLAAHPFWWRQREAALAALGGCADDLIDLMQGRLCDSSESLQLNVPYVLATYVLPGLDMQDCPLLCGSCVWFMARLTLVLPDEFKQKLIDVCLLFISADHHVFIRVCVARALFNMSSTAAGVGLLECYFAPIVNGLVSLAVLGIEPLVSLVLSALINCIRENAVLAATMESKILPLANACAIRYCGDAVIPSHAADIVRLLAQVPSIQAKVESRLVPTVVSVLDKLEDAKLPMRLPAVALELLEALICSARAPISSLLMDEAFPAVIGRILRSNDSDVLSAGRECLRAFVAVAPDQVVAWQNGQGAQLLVQVLCHLLAPESPDLSAAMVCRLVFVLLRHAADAVRPYLDQVLQAVLLKMASTQLSSVRQSMLIICCYMFNYELVPVIGYLSTLPSPNGNTNESALRFVFDDWFNRHRQLFGSHNRKVSTLALCKVLELGVVSGDQRLRFELGVPPRSALTVMTALIAADCRYFSAEQPVSQLNQVYEAVKTDEDSETCEQPVDDGRQFTGNNYLSDIIAGLANDAEDFEDDVEQVDSTFAAIDMNVYVSEFFNKLSQQHCWPDLFSTLSSEEQLCLSRDMT